MKMTLESMSYGVVCNLVENDYDRYVHGFLILV